MKTPVGQSGGSLSRAGGSYPTPPIVPRTSLFPATAASLSEPPFSNPEFEDRWRWAQQAQLGVAGQVWVGRSDVFWGGGRPGLDWRLDPARKEGRVRGGIRRVRWDVTAGDWSPTLPGR